MVGICCKEKLPFRCTNVQSLFEAQRRKVSQATHRSAENSNNGEMVRDREHLQMCRGPGTRELVAPVPVRAPSGAVFQGLLHEGQCSFSLVEYSYFR